MTTNTDFLPGQRLFIAIARWGLALSLGLLLGLAVPLAASGVWTGLGPPGAEVTALAAVPSSSVVYAGTKYGGVFKSTDGGATWAPSNAGLGAPWVLSLAVDPTTPSTIYAGLQSEGPNPALFKSTDSGATWSASANGLFAGSYASVYSLAIDPTNTSVLYAGSAQYIFKSTDAGASWILVKDFHAANITYLAIDSGHPSTLYAAGPEGPFPSGCGGLWKSTDSGATWVFLSNHPDTAVQEIVIDPTNSAKLYTVNIGCSAFGVYLSTDGGDTWATSLSTAAMSLVMDPTDHQTLYAGCEANWANVAQCNPGATCVTCGAPPNTVIKQLVSAGLYKTSNGGATWSRSDAGLPNDPCNTPPVAFDLRALAMASASVIYAGGWIDTQLSPRFGPSLFKSVNAGSSWVVAGPGLKNTFAQAIAIDPSTPAVMYAGLVLGESSSVGVEKSTDAGTNWTPMSNGLEIPPGFVGAGFPLPASVVVVNPLSPNIVLAGGGVSPGLFRSSDGAASWSPVFNSVARAVAIDPVTPTTAYMAGGDGFSGSSGIYKSTDSGNTWTQTSAPSYSFLALAIDPNNPSVVYAGNGGNVFKSSDGGLTWTALSGSPGGSVLIVTRGSSTLYSSVEGVGGGISKSTDGGVTWTPVVNGLTNLYVKALAADPLADNTIYAAADRNTFVSGSVFRTTDGGANWAEMPGIPPDIIYSLAVGPASSRFLYAATYGSGIQAICLPPIVTAASNSPICAGQTLQLTAPTISGATYSWTGPNGFTSTLQNPSIPNATVASGVYSVMATVGSCVSDSATTSVMVNARPTAPGVTTSSTIIGAGSPNRTASVPPHAGSTYAWAIANGTITSGQGTSQITFTGGMAGAPLTLSVTETNASGCMSAPGTAAVAVAPAGSAVLFYALPPCRILDTRIQTGALNAPSLQPAAARTFDLAASRCNVPVGAVAISANLTVTNAGAPGELVVFPADILRPNTTAISFRAGRTRANNAIVSFSKSAETFSVFNNSAATVDFILDVNGYFQ